MSVKLLLYLIKLQLIFTQAANPKASLEDFVRWYSPRDLIEEQKLDEETEKTITTCK